jgi:hypothetical protein
VADKNTNFGCQNTASQIQGDENEIALAYGQGNGHGGGGDLPD